ncbi:MAG TPA: hypothetical protein EYG86_01910 [Crocinitomicaceae bacterium]|nr:hypothetical protein [Crocinitomicaceae bacterium]
MTYRYSSVIVLLILLFSSCDTNPLLIDVSDSQVEINFVNVDEAIFYSDSSELISKHHYFKNELKNIYDYEIGHVLQIGLVEDTAFYNSIQLFRKDTSIQTLERRIATLLPYLEKKEENIKDGFSHLKYHFPEGVQPTTIAYLNALFSTAVFCTENEIGVGTEWYLGDTTDVVQQLNPQYFFDWMKHAMDVRYYERDILTGWIETHYVNSVEGNLAENMIRWGKILYLVEAAFPEKNPSIIVRYSEEDYEWALKNEENFWRYLVDEKLLFKSNDQTTRNMISEGPFTPGLPNQEAPDRYGQFLGWRMVHQYMKKNDVSVEKMVEASYNEILQDYEVD